MSEKLTGRCACGSVRFELTNTPLFVHCCHCTDCQRETGSAFAINALIEADKIKLISGSLRKTELPTESGRGHDEFRCAECGLSVWGDYGRRGYILFVRAGTLDAPHDVNPDVHIFTQSKRPWVRLPDGVPVYEKFYNMKELWPSASLVRRQAASDKAKGAR